MVFGIERAIHFLDKFTLLSEHMFGIQGLISTYYKLHTHEDFSLSFDLHFYEQMRNSDDGFLLLLSDSQYTENFLYPLHEDAGSSDFSQKLNSV